MGKAWHTGLGVVWCDNVASCGSTICITVANFSEVFCGKWYNEISTKERKNKDAALSYKDSSLKHMSLCSVIAGHSQSA
jgi:hypothetical protein